jgi:hypothetical protein
MRRRLALGVALASAVCLLAAPAAGARQLTTWRTVPPLPHARFLVDGKTVFANAKGEVTFDLPGVKTKFYPQHVHPQDHALGPDSVAKFARWYGKHRSLTYGINYRMTFAFRDLASNVVDSDVVTSMTLKSRTGVRTNVAKGAPVWLPGSRVVPFSGELVSKGIDYQVERAYVDGANVVNRAQQRFAPAKTRHLSVRLLFYSLKVSTRDALFGFPVGEAVELRYPSGRTVRRDLNDGKVTLPSLPRGTYDVKVVASGVSFTRPVSVSRNQEVELKVVSYLDMVLAFGAMIAVAVGLLLVRRPRLVRAVKQSLRMGRKPVGAGRE